MYYVPESYYVFVQKKYVRIRSYAQHYHIKPRVDFIRNLGRSNESEGGSHFRREFASNAL